MLAGQLRERSHRGQVQHRNTLSGLPRLAPSGESDTDTELFRFICGNNLENGGDFHRHFAIFPVNRFGYDQHLDIATSPINLHHKAADLSSNRARQSSQATTDTIR
jgi:hypothetical protein